MSEVFPIALFVLGIALGAVAIWLLGARESRTLDNMQRELTDAIAARARLEAQLAGEKKAAGEKLALLDEAQQRLSNAFAALSADALRTNNQSFLELAKTTLEKYQNAAQGDLDQRQQAIDKTVSPVREALEKVDAKIAALEKERVGAYSALNEQVKALAEGQVSLRSETSQLVRALSSPTVRGRWGEIQLRRVVEMAGMLDHCDFIEQESIETEDGRIRRPDLVVKMPGRGSIFVDAKAPIPAYFEAMQAPDEATRRNLVQAFAQKVRSHIGSLAKKAYWTQLGDAPELVVMFLPGEMFFSAALEADPALIEAGAEQNIVLATPTTLIGLLRAIYYGWRQETIAQDAKKIGELGRELYKRLADLGDHFAKLGASLRTSVESYNKAMGTLESRVLVSARRFRDLHAVGTDADLPELRQVERAPRSLQAPEIVGDRLFPPDEQPAGEEPA
jgi:DNA recombination protein RmuC